MAMYSICSGVDHLGIVGTVAWEKWPTLFCNVFARVADKPALGLPD
jgi:hypothetical protein